MAESGNEVNLPYEPDRRIVIMHTTWAKDADYGALMVRFVEVSVRVRRTENDSKG